MRKINAFAVYSCFSRSISNSDEGDKYRWMARDLREKRELALRYMGDIKLRIPIHESIRRKVILNKNFTSDVDLSSLLETNNTQGSDFNFSTFDDCINDILTIDEKCADSLDFVCRRDVPLLKDELTRGSLEEETTVRNWLKLRKETSDYHNYASIPENERTSWSAWYLRNVKAPPSDI